MTKHDASTNWILEYTSAKFSGNCKTLKWWFFGNCFMTWVEIEIMAGCFTWMQQCGMIPEMHQHETEVQAEAKRWDPDRGQVQMLRISRSEWHESCRQAVHGLSRQTHEPLEVDTARLISSYWARPWINWIYWIDMHVCMSSKAPEIFTNKQQIHRINYDKIETRLYIIGFNLPSRKNNSIDAASSCFFTRD